MCRCPHCKGAWGCVVLHRLAEQKDHPLAKLHSISVPQLPPAAGAQAASLDQTDLLLSLLIYRKGGGTQEWLEVHTKIYSTILVLQVLINEETRSRRATIFKIQGFTFNVWVTGKESSCTRRFSPLLCVSRSHWDNKEYLLSASRLNSTPRCSPLVFWHTRAFFE